MGLHEADGQLFVFAGLNDLDGATVINQSIKAWKIRSKN